MPPHGPSGGAVVTGAAAVAAAPVLSSSRVWSSVHDQYRTLEILGQGTYGVVYKAEHRTTGELVAMKRCRLDVFRDFGIPETTLREITLLKDLRDHSNIMTLQRLSCNTERLYMICEFLEFDLKKYIRNARDGVSLKKVKNICFDILRGVAFCHAHRVLHRDLKPHNVLVSHDASTVKIADFGLARSGLVPGKTLTHEVITLWYRAPELLLGHCDYTAAVDVWSVGCIVAELLSTRPLFVGDSEIDTLFRIFRHLGSPAEKDWPKHAVVPWSAFPVFQGKPNPFGGLSNDLDDAGKDLLTKMFMFNPADRITAADAIRHPWLAEVFRERRADNEFPLVPVLPKELPELTDDTYAYPYNPHNRYNQTSPHVSENIAGVSTAPHSERGGLRVLSYSSKFDASWTAPQTHRDLSAYGNSSLIVTNNNSMMSHSTSTTTAASEVLRITQPPPQVGPLQSQQHQPQQQKKPQQQQPHGRRGGQKWELLGRFKRASLGSFIDRKKPKGTALTGNGPPDSSSGSSSASGCQQRQPPVQQRRSTAATDCDQPRRASHAVDPKPQQRPLQPQQPSQQGPLSGSSRHTSVGPPSTSTSLYFQNKGNSRPSTAASICGGTGAPNTSAAEMRLAELRLASRKTSTSSVHAGLSDNTFYLRREVSLAGSRSHTSAYSGAGHHSNVRSSSSSRATIYFDAFDGSSDYLHLLHAAPNARWTMGSTARRRHSVASLSQRRRNGYP